MILLVFDNQICQIVAYKDGVEVYTDEWNGYKRRYLSYHVSNESIVSLLIGIALEQGLIKVSMIKY